MLFGFLDPFDFRQSPQELGRYGASLAEADPHSIRHASASSYAVWAPKIAQAASTAVAVQGTPHWISSPSGEERASDPAVEVLEAYQREGESFLERLWGDFSVAILDAHRRRALLAVDPMGVSRLTFAVKGTGIAFGSSAEAVARFPALGGARLRSQAIFEYLLLHAIPSPGTIFDGVQKLEPGSCARFEDGKLTVERYWRPKFATRTGEGFPSLKSELHVALHNAVQNCQPDQATGAFLSGGLDSSTVSGVLARVTGKQAQTFSIGFGYPEYDELEYARITNAHFGCTGHEYVVRGADIVTAFPLIARTYDEPFGNSSALPTYYCARLAREYGVTHLLAGDGGDELFAGNSRYADQRIFELYGHLPRWLRRSVLEPMFAGNSASTGLPLMRKASGYIRHSMTPLPDRLERWNLLVRLGFGDVFRGDFLAAVDPELPFEQMRKVWDATPSENYMHRMLYYDWHYTLADNDLRKVGMMCALAGVRVSFPMLDRGVVEMSTSVPPQLMMPGRKLRDFYKRAMRGFLPDAVITKKKHGFGLPFGLWLRESADLRQLIRDNLADLRRRAILLPGFLDVLIRLHGEDDARYYGVFVWVAAMLEQWLREHELSI